MTTERLTRERAAEILDAVNMAHVAWRADPQADRTSWSVILELPEYDGPLTEASFQGHDMDHAIVADRVLCWVVEHDGWTLRDDAQGAGNATIIFEDDAWRRWTNADDDTDIEQVWGGDRWSAPR